MHPSARIPDRRKRDLERAQTCTSCLGPRKCCWIWTRLSRIRRRIMFLASTKQTTHTRQTRPIHIRRMPPWPRGIQTLRNWFHSRRQIPSLCHHYPCHISISKNGAIPSRASIAKMTKICSPSRPRIRNLFVRPITTGFHLLSTRRKRGDSVRVSTYRILPNKRPGRFSNKNLWFIFFGTFFINFTINLKNLNPF